MKMRTKNKNWQEVELGNVMSLEYGGALKGPDRIEGEYPVFGSSGVVGYHNSYMVEGPSIIIGRKGNAGSVKYSKENCFPIDTTFYINIKNHNKVDLLFLYYCLSILNMSQVSQHSAVSWVEQKRRL